MAALSPRDARAEDYLNDQLQTAADLEGLDGLIENVRKQQKLLEEQEALLTGAYVKLSESRQNLAESTEASEVHASALMEQAQAFKRQQADVDRRLLIVAQSETSDDAIEQFDADIRSLQDLEVATNYVELLAHVEYLREAQPAAEGAAPHLVDHVHQTALSLWRQLKNILASELEKLWTEMKWPGKSVTLAGKLKSQWTDGVERLLDLQEPQLNAQSDNVKPHEEPLVLLPLEVMVKPLELHFQYHFAGDRPTNKLDKPEYFLSHIVGLLHQYDEFFAIYLQPILRNRFRSSHLSMTSVFIDSTSAFITALLPMVRRKVFGVISQVAKQPQLLSHFIHELMSFDINLRAEWGYDGGCGIDGWKGLTWEVLVKKDWFGRWLEVEKNFALSRYQNIIDTPESGEIDYESVDFSATKPTNAAIRVNDLLETITDRYRPLPSFSQKLRFLIDIQIAVFDLFHARLASSLEAYLTLTSTLTSSLARAGSRAAEASQPDLHGLAGLERLARVYGSAEYLEKKMRDWSDDVFFLELWEELQDRARAGAKGERGGNVGGNMSVEHVADKTSAAVGSNDGGGALFDETAGAYRRLRVKAEGIMTDHFVQNVRDSLKAYGRVNTWSALPGEANENLESNSSSLAISAELDRTIQLLQSYLAFLAKVLAQAALRRITRQVMLTVQTYLWDHVLMRYTFSSTGAKQFERDVHGIWEVVDQCIGVGQGEVGMRRLAEGLVLLLLRTGFAVDAETSMQSEEQNLNVEALEKRLYQGNENGRQMLEELGLELLSESEARSVLERRVDFGR
ncbi:MAG: hypothetical protein L6R35_000633 [Caloplaca aegaea]|nr:MAG: hypothetical protein L6R35_000633 [Caloplaca aegaea]